MWFAPIFALCLFCISNAWYTTVDDYQTDKDDDYTSLQSTWTRKTGGYWIIGLQNERYGSDSDRRYKWIYGRPDDDNTDYSISQSTVELDSTFGKDDWTRECEEDDDGYSYAIYKIVSSEYLISGSLSKDRQFTISCKRMQYQFSLQNCAWTDPHGEDGDDISYECDGLIRSIRSDRYTLFTNYDRRWMFECCDVRNTPMDVQTTYTSDRLLTDIASDYSNGARSIEMTHFGTPKWYHEDDEDVVQSVYSLTRALPSTYFWERVCPRNGALTSFTYDDATDMFSFKCGTLVADITSGDCEWTDYVNEFHAGFTKQCPTDGVMRGIQSYYSAASDDRKFNFYCCVLKREDYEPSNDIVIKLKCHADTYSGGTGALTLDLCWNSYLYQAVLVLAQTDTWYATDDVVQYGSCGNDRVLTVSTSSTNGVKIAALKVNAEGVDYTIYGFNVYESVQSESTYTYQGEFGLDLDGIEVTDVVIKYPDDYLTGCTSGGGCVGDLYFLDDYQQYLITITTCESFDSGDETASIGVVLRGLNGNLDRAILTLSSLEELPIGRGNIGELIHVNIEYESGPDVCIQEITLHDPFDTQTTFGTEYFGDGIILSGDCLSDGDFRLLTGIQYVPCYDTPFSITTYESSLYISIQIHACSGNGAGISQSNSGLLSFTITGLSKNDKFVSTSAYSLRTTSSWMEGTSRDYTLQISDEFDKLALVSITNNHGSDAMCIDSVLINGVDAFLSHYWVGSTPDHDALSTIPAVLEWPICDVELTTTIKAETALPVDPDSVATSVCVNRNRLVSVDCEISQTFETYEEVTWEQEMGEEVTKDITMEQGTETSLSSAFTLEENVGMEAGSEFFSISYGLSVSSTTENSRAWSASTSVSNGFTKMEVTTDGTVNGKTIGIECSGSVSVPPSQQVEYAMLIDHSAATLTTLTDIKMTKCSAYLYGDDYYDPNDYIYIYGVEGQLTVKDATNCYVSFSQAEQVNPESITCGQERALATREWGTYVPQCDAADPELYKECQCAYGDSLTLPTCGCVDPTSGNLLDTAVATVVAETDEYKWTDWCADNCGSDSYSAAKVETPKQLIGDVVGDDWKKMNLFDHDYEMQVMVVAIVFLGMIAVTYMINSCAACYKDYCRTNVNKYQPLRYFDTDTEMERQEVV
eukprot:195766_1